MKMIPGMRKAKEREWKSGEMRAIKNPPREGGLEGEGD